MTLYCLVVAVAIQALYGSITTRLKYKRASSMDCKERVSHAHSIPSAGTARVKQEVGTDTRIIVTE